MTELRVVAAAVLTEDGVVHSMPAPARHHHIIHALHPVREALRVHLKRDELPPGMAPHPYHGEQGFLLNDGTFAGRIAAGQIALDAKQIPKLAHPPQLYSEDLW